jgi:hypothetical protein
MTVLPDDVGANLLEKGAPFADFASRSSATYHDWGHVYLSPTHSDASWLSVAIDCNRPQSTTGIGPIAAIPLSQRNHLWKRCGFVRPGTGGSTTSHLPQRSRPESAAHSSRLFWADLMKRPKERSFRRFSA